MRLNPFKLSINNLSATVHNEMPRHLKIRNIAQHSKKSTWTINPQSSWSFTVNNHNKLNIAQHSKERHGDNIRPWIFFFLRWGGVQIGVHRRDGYIQENSIFTHYQSPQYCTTLERENNKLPLHSKVHRDGIRQYSKQKTWTIRPQSSLK